MGTEETAALTRLLQRASSANARVLLLAAVQLLGAVALWFAFLRDTGPALAKPHVGWWVLLPAFALAQYCVFAIQVRREAQSVSLMEIPLVLGLFYAAPLELVLARTFGALLILGMTQRHTPVKLIYNSVMVALEATVALVVFHAVLDVRMFGIHGDALSVHGWVATYLAVTAASIVVGLSIGLVLVVFEGPIRLSELLRSIVRFGPWLSVVAATVALTGVYALRASPLSAVPLLVSLGVLLVGYRIYARLSDRYLQLERIYRFSQAVTSTPEIDDVLCSVLNQARELLRTDAVEMLFASGESSYLRVTLASAGRLERNDQAVDPSDWVWRRVMTGTSTLLPRTTAPETASGKWLDSAHLREAVMVPLHGEVGVIGALLVGDRECTVKPYDEHDVELLETVASHASLALQNGRLVDQLRHEALHDGLTGLANRKLLYRRLGEVLSHRDAPVGEHARAVLFVMDLDGFKQVNDSFGHQSGDLVLQEVASRLTGAIRNEDLVARLGGDEFAILAGACSTEQEVADIAELILGSLAAPMTIQGRRVAVGASLGAALAWRGLTDGSSLLKQADIAMYAAKRRGGGFRLYDSSLGSGQAEIVAINRSRSA